MNVVIIEDEKPAARRLNRMLNDFVDLVDDKFLTKNGELSKDIMPDLLHPKETGYTIWAEAIEPTLARLYDMK